MANKAAFNACPAAIRQQGYRLLGSSWRDKSVQPCLQGLNPG
jgi:hypothetical protein